MTGTYRAGLICAALALLACSPTTPPRAQNSPAAHPTSSATAQPAPTTTTSPQPEQSPTSPAALVTCTRGPATAMVVVAGQFLYDVTDPVHPVLICRAENTYLRLLGGNAIAYTTVVTGTATVAVRRDLTTGAVTRIGDLRISPQPYYYAAASWTSDGLFEVYATSSPASAT